MRALLLALLVVASAAATGVAPAAAQQDPAYTVTVDLPDTLVVGENTVEVIVDNTAGSAELFSPLIEVPLGTSLDVPEAGPNPTVEVGGTTEDRTWDRLNSSFRSGEALHIYGEEVPAGESRTYSFTLVVESAGSRTVEADVRPLYNEDANVRDDAVAQATGPGTLTVDVLNPDGSAVPGATATVGGDSHAAGSAVDVAPDSFDVTATGGGVGFPTMTVGLAEFEAETVTFVRRSDLSDPGVVASVGDQATVVDGTVTQTAIEPGTATTPKTVEVSFLLDLNGTAVVALADPPEANEVSDRTVSVSAGTATTTVDGDVLRIEVDADSTVDVSIEYEGQAVGDADGDGTVDASDAAAVADAIVGGTVGGGAADVDGDGELTAIDAMFIAQHANGKRDDEYRRH